MSAYFARLRARIGTDLLLVPTVAVLPVDPDGRVLLVRHAHSGQWATVGGAVEPDEAPLVAARREAKEETGLDVNITALLAALGGPDYRLTYPNGDECACVAIVYAATVVGGVPTPDGEETIDVAWFRVDELDALDIGPLNVRLLAEALPLLPAAV